MGYPPAPWRMRGDALFTTRLVDAARVRALIPQQFKIVTFLPGKTFGTVYFADYQRGSDLVYHELIIAPALVRYGANIGAWISHIYVDHPDSVAGGREIWGLPKEPARFEWDLTGGRVAAWQEDRLLCAFHSRPPGWRLPAPAILPFLSLLQDQVLKTMNSFKTGLAVTKGMVEIPGGSPFAGFGLEGPVMAYHQQRTRFTAGGPKRIGRVVPAQAGEPAVSK